MFQNRRLNYLFFLILGLLILSWSKYLFTGSIKVDDNPFGKVEDWVIVISYLSLILLVGYQYYRLYKEADGSTLTFKQIKRFGYGILVLSGLMLPILSNDIFLYIAYGDVSNLGVDVFTQKNTLSQSKWLPYIGKWVESPYLYGPLTLWVGKMANALGGNNIFLVYYIIKLIGVLLGVVFLEMIGLMVRSSANFVWITLTPILWLQNIGGFHYDLLAATFLLISIYFISQQKIVFALLLVALAAMCKIVFIIFLPYIIIHYFMINPGRLNLKCIGYFTIGLIAFAMIAVLSYYPFWTGPKTLGVPLGFLSMQEPSKSFSEVLGEIIHTILGNVENTSYTSDGVSGQKLMIWKYLRMIFNIIGILLALILSIRFLVKTGLKFNRSQLTELWVKLTMIFFFFYSHIFNAWYLIALLPFIPLIADNQRLKKYLLIVCVYSNAHMIFLNVDKASAVYYLIFPIIFANIALFMWQFRKNYLTIESPAHKDI